MVASMMKDRGMQTFLTIWVGQLVSILGTAMTRFALMIWAYEQAGNATTLAMIGFFNFGGYLLASPLAGVLVDRWNRRTVMLAADGLSGLMTLAMLALFLNGRLEIWHLYLAEALSGGFDAFQTPAYSSSISLLAPAAHYARLNGMVSFAYNSGRVLAPMLAGLMLVRFDLAAVMAVDIVTLAIAAGTLLAVRIPTPPASPDGTAARGDFVHQMRFGLRYVFARPGLMGLMLVYAGINLFAALTYFSILPALVLARTGAN
ncbi:MAG TPA: MFS transporter, partial [Anaerolineaceae bacterium]|nr:MFS transporter [Anaerolineaceae bacterium]